MNEETFLERRKSSWVRLMELCDLADRSPTDLSRDQLLELFTLYRRISTDLATARTISTSPSLISYLNDLTGRAYSVVYREPRQSLVKVLVNAVKTSADTVRRRRYFVFSSVSLLFGSALAIFLLCHLSPGVRDYFVSRYSEIFDQWKSGNFETRTGSANAAMTSFYASHNPQVAIVTGAIGAGSFGFLSIAMMLQNGAMLGALASEMVPVNRLDYLLSSISPHSVPEMSGIIFAGACGLLLGWSLINPGNLTRAESLRSCGRDAITLLATSVVMMFIAAPIEAFFSFNPLVPGWLKTTLAITSLGTWLYFWSSFGRSPSQSAEESAATRSRSKAGRIRLADLNEPA